MAVPGRSDRPGRVGLAGILAASLAFCPGQAVAQATNHDGDPTQFAPSSGAASHAARPGARAVRPGRAAPAARPAPAAARAIPIPPVPPPPSLPPPLVVPVRPPPPLVPATVVLNAPGEAVAGKDSLRLTFGPDNTALNPATDAAVRALAHAPHSAPAVDFTIVAFAAPVPDDPSAARRLSLSRALAVRSILINEGVTSVHIYVKALGAPPPEDKPADRVDVTASQNVPATKPSP